MPQRPDIPRRDRQGLARLRRLPARTFRTPGNGADAPPAPARACSRRHRAAAAAASRAASAPDTPYAR